MSKNNENNRSAFIVAVILWILISIPVAIISESPLGGIFWTGAIIFVLFIITQKT